MNPDREWWLRVPAVLLSPRAVFVALRNEEREDVEARAEPVLALTLLAGVAGAFATPTARTLYDDPLFDGVALALWLVFAAGIIAFTGYYLVGGAVYLGARGLGSEGTFRRARQLLAFALVPVALSALTLWPLGLAIFGTDLFSRGGADDGAGGTLLYGLAAAFGLWSAGLLLVGVRAVHGWTWARSAAALALVALFRAALAYAQRLLEDG